VRGYLRTYAKTVGVSSDEIIHAFNELGIAEVRSIVPPEQIQDRVPTTNFRSTRLVKATLLSIFTFLAIIAWWYSQNEKAQIVTQTIASLAVPLTAPPVKIVSESTSTQATLQQLLAVTSQTASQSLPQTLTNRSIQPQSVKPVVSAPKPTVLAQATATGAAVKPEVQKPYRKQAQVSLPSPVDAKETDHEFSED
jgi:cytoskeletal protein RodZ